jgi:hypothetical protein
MLKAFCFVLALILCTSATAHAASPRAAAKTVTAVSNAVGATGKAVLNTTGAAAAVGAYSCWWWGKPCPKNHLEWSGKGPTQ